MLLISSSKYTHNPSTSDDPQGYHTAWNLHHLLLILLLLHPKLHLDSFLLLFVWSMPHTMWDLSSLEGMEPLSLQGDHRVLTTGPPGKSVEKGNPTNQISPDLSPNLPSMVLCQHRNQTDPLKLKYKPDQVLPLFLSPTGVFHFLQRKSRSPCNDLQVLYGLTWSPCRVIYSAPVVFTFSLFLEHTSHTFIFIGSSFSPELSFIGGYCLTLLSF